MWEITCLVSLILFGFAIWRMFFSNRIIVEPGPRERVVLRDLRGEMRVLGPGTHYLSPIWKEFRRVETNREPIEVGSDSVKTSTNVMVEIGYRYDILVGRPFDKQNGILMVTNIDDTSQIDDDEVKSAVSKIDYDDHKAQIQQRVRSVMEQVFAGLTDIELFLIDTDEKGPVIIPKKEEEPDWIMKAVDIEDRTQRLFPDLPKEGIKRAKLLYDRLSKLIELKVNYDLRFLGINIVSFQITLMRYLASEMQKALEARQQRERLEEATEGMKLTSAQQFSLNTDQFGQVTQAEAIKDASKNVSEAVTKVIESWLKGGKP